MLQVALLAEGVDRNKDKDLKILGTKNVALLAEGVDRNCALDSIDLRDPGRPPRGGRG